MGNAESGEEHGALDNGDMDPFDGIETLGYRVLGVQPNSPAAKAGLVSFLDFIVGANGEMLLGSGEDLEEGEEYDDVDFPDLLASNKDKAVELLVWNIKSQEERLVSLVPSEGWGGAGLLGVTIRLDNYAGAENRLIRILSVDGPQSPAGQAGLVAEKDYLLGTTHQSLDGTDVLSQMLYQYRDQVVELYVYNSDTDRVRVAALMPCAWDGQGLLGAEVGIGYLHRFPASCCNTTGSSVERKVRQVVVPTEEGAGTESKTDSSDEVDSAANAPKTEPSEPVALEMEPQLEMEQSESDVGDNHDRHKTIEQVTAQPSEEEEVPRPQSEDPTSQAPAAASLAQEQQTAPVEAPRDVSQDSNAASRGQQQDQTLPTAAMAAVSLDANAEIAAAPQREEAQTSSSSSTTGAAAVAAAAAAGAALAAGTPAPHQSTFGMPPPPVMRSYDSSS